MSWLPGRNRKRRSSKAALLSSASRESTHAPKVARDPVVPGLRCPNCKGKVVIKKRKSDGRPFLSCSRYPLCAYSAPIPKPKAP